MKWRKFLKYIGAIPMKELADKKVVIEINRGILTEYIENHPEASEKISVNEHELIKILDMAEKQDHFILQTFDSRQNLPPLNDLKVSQTRTHFGPYHSQRNHPQLIGH